VLLGRTELPRQAAGIHQDESPEVLAGLYSAVERMRLTSSGDVVRVAEQVVRFVVGGYAAPDKSFDELRELVKKQGRRRSSEAVQRGVPDGTACPAPLIADKQCAF